MNGHLHIVKYIDTQHVDPNDFPDWFSNFDDMGVAGLPANGRVGLMCSISALQHPKRWWKQERPQLLGKLNLTQSTV